MDRAEAIKILEAMATDMVGCFTGTISNNYAEFLQRRIDTIDMAIAALREQEQSKAVQPFNEGATHNREQWISVKERLPCNEDVVLCVTKNNRPFVCRYDHYWKHWRVSGSVKVTHWMPLPGPPKGGAGG